MLKLGGGWRRCRASMRLYYTLYYFCYYYCRYTDVCVYTTTVDTLMCVCIHKRRQRLYYTLYYFCYY